MIRVKNLDASLHFYCELLGLKEVRRYDNEKGRFSLIFLAAPNDFETAQKTQAPTIELTYNWDPEDYQGGRNFGHLAFLVDNIYESCKTLQDGGAHQEMATWLLYAHRTTSPLNYYSAATHCHPRSRGYR